MAVIDLEDKIVEIVNRENQSEFLYELLEVYDVPKATITRLKKGNQNLTKRAGEVHLKNKVWFKETQKGKLFAGFVEVEEQVAELSAKPRYLLVTDFDGILAKDTKTQEALDIKFEELPQHFDFFLAWKGIEKVDFEKENPADIKAAERFARLYDVLRKENNITDNKGLDLFLIRLLFCLFAEDTDIFKRSSFTNSIKTLTEQDGSDLNKFFKDLFVVLDRTERDDVPLYLKEFPYVNGQLFTEPHEELKFSTKSRKLIIECGELLNWAKINPDIFGSMIQAVASEVSRSHLGMHYTSVPNIMKVIKPLFLDQLYEEFEKAYDIMDKLNLLYERIGKIKFFDPACGSGNFLIITYKELRRLEIKILLRQRELAEYIMYLPSVTLNQFYGIEIDDFAHDVAKLSLWIAEHQMNMELEEIFQDKVRATLPLHSAGEIRCANALRVDWNEVCPRKENEEVYIFGNPPYYGSRNQKISQKQDMEYLLKSLNGYKKLDYISGWFLLAAEYIEGNNAQFAFVSTNSLFQGEQVPILWDKLSSFNIEISFVYSSFRWDNNAKDNAGVTVVIVGFSTKGLSKGKKIYTYNKALHVENINPYLASGHNVIVKKSTRQLLDLPKISKGNAAYDDGKFTFSVKEFNQLADSTPELLPFMKKYMSAEDFIYGTYKYCLWITKENLKEAEKLPFIKDRINQVREYRLSSDRAVTRKQAEIPYAFGEIRYQKKPVLIIPVVSSETREYIPIGIISQDIIPSYATFTIYDPPLWLLGVLHSKMHMAWAKAVAGGLESRIRYSAGLCYNTFPVPDLSTRKKNEIEEATLEILDIREELGGTLAELYNPQAMPMNLKLAHEKLDRIVERAYRQKAFQSDEERLEVLLKMYQEMTER